LQKEREALGKGRETGKKKRAGVARKKALFYNEREKRTESRGDDWRDRNNVSFLSVSALTE
jgi:hypothetical protein